MNKYTFDALMILLMAGILSLVVYFNFSELYLNFSMIPLIAFYFIGQYSQRKFGNFDKVSS
jgi:hypothetical protein